MPAPSDPHAFQSPSRTDCRSPCPALNALANHGYLPHDGHNISFVQAVRAMKDVYNISYPLGIFLALGGMFLCGQWWRLPWKFDLHELAKHNKIEHDGSLCHRDAGPEEQFAPVRVDHTLLDRLLCITKADSFSILDFAQARIKRAMENRKPLDAIHREIAHGEASLTINVFGKAPKVPDDRHPRVAQGRSCDVSSNNGSVKTNCQMGWQKAYSRGGLCRDRQGLENVGDTDMAPGLGGQERMIGLHGLTNLHMYF
ncbi:heme-thiolate peroxidase [Phlebia brevispora]|uniref:Heme-thiolate peroxidase n=1 Tax=Phlebia brevispora TaxID=194682 RepID=A0ACC1T2X3_9APHY|nr:heme-thiolate peroxidase [Phlebia brevispora]